MNAPELLYCEGQAEFPAELATLPPLAAWQRALQEPALLAATGGRFAVALRLAAPALAFNVDTGSPDLAVSWDNTFKYSAGWRVRAPWPARARPRSRNWTMPAP